MIILHVYHQYCFKILGEENEYFSSDFIDRFESTNFDAFEHVTSEFLSALKTFGLPNYSIKLKIGASIICRCTTWIKLKDYAMVQGS